MNKETFARLVIDSTDSLYRVSKSILGNDSDCEDAASEAITIAFQKLDSLKKNEYAKTWLTRILINECFHIRKHQNRIALFPDNMESVLNSHNCPANRNVAENMAEQRMERMPKEEKKTLLNEVDSQTANATTYSRELTQKEEEILQILDDSYKKQYALKETSRFMCLQMTVTCLKKKYQYQRRRKMYRQCTRRQKNIGKIPLVFQMIIKKFIAVTIKTMLETESV